MLSNLTTFGLPAYSPLPDVHVVCYIQMQAERNQAMDRVDMLDTELTAVRADSMGLQGALQKEQQRSAEVELAMVAKDKVGIHL